MVGRVQIRRADPRFERPSCNIIGVITSIAAERKCSDRWSRHLRRCCGLVWRAATAAELEMMLRPCPKDRRPLPSTSLCVKLGKAPVTVIEEQMNVWVEIFIWKG